MNFLLHLNFYTLYSAFVYLFNNVINFHRLLIIVDQPHNVCKIVFDVRVYEQNGINLNIENCTSDERSCVRASVVCVRLVT